MAVMISLLTAGTIYLMINRNNTTTNHSYGKIEILKDSLDGKDLVKTSIFSRWMELNGLRNKINKISEKDSISPEEIESIRKIDQELNQLLHERN
jgi:predicted RND superfamily exporter protein